MTDGPRKRVLFLTHRIPYPPDKGDKIRAWHILQYLAARYDVVLGSFIDQAADEAHRNTVAALSVDHCLLSLPRWRGRARALRSLPGDMPASAAWYRDPRMIAFIADQRRRGLDAEIVFSSALAPYAEGAAAPVIFDLCDVDSAKWSSYAREGAPWQRCLHAREARTLARTEAAAVARSARTFLISPEEKAVLDRGEGVDGTKTDWFRNGIDLAYWQAAVASDPDGFDVVFTGAMDYRPNIEAAIWFADRCWPAIRDRHPAARFGIVGSNPGRAVRALGALPGITVTGRVDDMRPYLARAKVAVAPLQIARGVQNKVLEAMATGLAVVASSGAIEGTGAEPGRHLVRADTPEDTAEAVNDLLNHEDARRRFGREAARYIATAFAWDQALAPLGDAIDTVTA